MDDRKEHAHAGNLRHPAEVARHRVACGVDARAGDRRRDQRRRTRPATSARPCVRRGTQRAQELHRDEGREPGHGHVRRARRAGRARPPHGAHVPPDRPGGRLPASGRHQPR